MPFWSHSPFLTTLHFHSVSKWQHRIDKCQRFEEHVNVTEMFVNSDLISDVHKHNYMFEFITILFTNL